MEVNGAEFAALVETHRGAVHRYVVRRVPADDVDDVVAEAFASAWRHRSELPEALDLWLYRAAWHAVLHNYRSNRRRSGLFDRLVATHLQADSLEPGAPDLGWVRRAIESLPEADREVIRLAYWEDLDTSEIAWVLGVTPGAVRVRLHRARIRLTRALPDPPGRAGATTRQHHEDRSDVDRSRPFRALDPMQEPTR